MELAIQFGKSKLEKIDASIWEDPHDIGHWFTDETLRKLKIDGGGFMLPAEENKFRGMIVRRGRDFAFLPDEIGCIDPTIMEPMVIFTVPHVPWNINQFQYRELTSRN